MVHAIVFVEPERSTQHGTTPSYRVDRIKARRLNGPWSGITEKMDVRTRTGENKKHVICNFSFAETFSHDHDKKIWIVLIYRIKHIQWAGWMDWSVFGERYSSSLYSMTTSVTILMRRRLWRSFRYDVSPQHSACMPGVVCNILRAWRRSLNLRGDGNE